MVFVAFSVVQRTLHHSTWLLSPFMILSTAKNHLSLVTSPCACVKSHSCFNPPCELGCSAALDEYPRSIHRSSLVSQQLFPHTTYVSANCLRSLGNPQWVPILLRSECFTSPFHLPLWLTKSELLIYIPLQSLLAWQLYSLSVHTFTSNLLHENAMKVSRVKTLLGPLEGNAYQFLKYEGICWVSVNCGAHHEYLRNEAHK